jgi:hypothetical protein
MFKITSVANLLPQPQKSGETEIQSSYWWRTERLSRYKVALMMKQVSPTGNDRRRGIPGGGSTEIAELSGGAEERESEVMTEGWNGVGSPAGVYIDPEPRDSCPPSTSFISDS